MQRLTYDAFVTVTITKLSPDVSSLSRYSAGTSSELTVARLPDWAACISVTNIARPAQGTVTWLDLRLKVGVGVGAACNFAKGRVMCMA